MSSFQYFRAVCITLVFMSGISILMSGCTATPALIEPIPVESVATAESVNSSTLLEWLDGEDIEHRIEAAYQLGELKANDPIVIGALLKATSDNSDELQIVAAYAIGKIGVANNAVLARLTELLSSANADVRYSTARSLTLLGAEADEALPALISLLAEEDDDGVRHAAFVAIEAMESEISDELLALLVEALEDP
ncbi:MAG: HEAT repeat domain-containing protein, partial [Nitrospirales bacterium]